MRRIVGQGASPVAAQVLEIKLVVAEITGQLFGRGRFEGFLRRLAQRPRQPAGHGVRQGPAVGIQKAVQNRSTATRHGHLEPPPLARIEAELDGIEALGARLLASSEPDYPPLLAQLGADLHGNCPVLWIAIDEDDNDANRLYAALVQSVEPLGLTWDLDVDIVTKDGEKTDEQKAAQEAQDAKEGEEQSGEKQQGEMSNERVQKQEMTPEEAKQLLEALRQDERTVIPIPQQRRSRFATPDNSTKGKTW